MCELESATDPPSVCDSPSSIWSIVVLPLPMGPTTASTVGELIDWLAARDDTYAHAFEKPKVIRAAIDHAHVKQDAAISGAREIAFFPPMTGG